MRATAGLLVGFVGALALAAGPVTECGGEIAERFGGVSGAEKDRLAWEVTVDGMAALRSQFPGMESLTADLASVVLAGTFAWLSGDAGGAKTLVCRKLLEAELRSFPEKDKRIFLIQFHKLVAEGVITGFPKIQKMISDGKYEIETSTSLVGDKYVLGFLDELEKANPATLAALLSVLNERKAFLGGRIVDAVLLAGFSTSNKGLEGFLDSFLDDRPTGEALLDRFHVKSIVPNQTPSAVDDFFLLAAIRDSGRGAPFALALHHLAPLLDRVKLSRQMLWHLVRILAEVDSQLTRLSERSLEAKRRDRQPDAVAYIQATQFSTRTMRALLRLAKARFLVEQIVNGIPFERARWSFELHDLVHSSTGSIFSGPGNIRPLRIPHAADMRGIFGAVRPQVPVQIDPYAPALFYRNLDDGKRIERVRLDPTTFLPVSDVPFASDDEASVVAELVRRHNRATVQYEEDDVVARLLDGRSLSRQAEADLTALRTERGIFLGQLNAVLSDPGLSAAPPSPVPRQRPGRDEAVRRWEAIEKGDSADPLERAWVQSQLFYWWLNEEFFELDHAARAGYCSILSDLNLYVFGPAGGAKTSFLSLLFNAELKSLNASRKGGEPYELFFLQFHKLVPEGAIIGFPRMDHQLQTGELKYEIHLSLIHPRFRFAILDEAEKASTGTLASLLGVTNEREAYLGSEVHKAGLAVAAYTSNKTTAEFLDAFGEDRPTGQALLDRAVNKVYVYNKPSTTEALLEYLWRFESRGSGSPADEAPLPLVTGLKPLVDSVEIPQAIELMALEVRREYLKRRSQAGRESRSAYLEAPLDHPNVYEPATQPSNRTLVAAIRQWKAAFLVDQLARGVPYDKIRLKMSYEHLALLAHGLLYWGPWHLTPSATDGILQFERGGILEALRSKPSVPDRQKAMQGMILAEVDAFLEILNARFRRLALEQRELIASFPNLFPGLISDPAAYREWLVQNPPAPPTGTGSGP